MFSVPMAEHNETAVLLGMTPANDMFGSNYFVMFYDSETRVGILEPIEGSLETDNLLLNGYFPELFKKPEPKPENPVLAYVRGMPWKAQMEMACNFTNVTLLGWHEDVAIAYKYIMELFGRVELPEAQASTELDLNSDFSLGTLSDQLVEICPVINAFFQGMGMTYFLSVGTKMAAGRITKLIISLGPREEINFD